MGTGTESIVFLLREGATQEERWSWEDLEDMCRSGQLGAEARVFVEPDGQWQRIADTDLASCLSSERGPDPDDDPVRETLELDYQATLERLHESPEQLDALIEAGALACELGKREEARRHFQQALDLRPFHARAAGEIKRRFSRSECEEFRALERPAPAWEDIHEVALFAFSGGVVPFAVSAGVLIVMGLLQVPIPFVIAAAMIWATRLVAHVAQGARAVPRWQDLSRSPLRRIAFPGALVLVVCAGALALVTALGRGLMVIDETSLSVPEYVVASPVLTVTVILAAIAYLPATLLILASDRPLRAIVPWLVIAGAVRVGQEYAMSLILCGACAFVCALVYFLAGTVPGVAPIVTATVVAVFIPSIALVLGVVLARHTHVLGGSS